MENEAVVSEQRDSGEELPLGQLRESLGDLFIPNQAIYWRDFLSTIALFYVSFGATGIGLAHSLRELWRAAR